MNFLFPAFLYGLGLIAIPVIIHFFNFQRAKKVYFTNVAYLKTVKDITTSRNKLKNLLVLLARICFIACLVLAFARPFIPNENSNALTGNGNYVSIYFDNSYSMENEQDNRRLFDIAKSHVEQIVKVFPNTTVFQLLDNSFSPNSRFFYEADKVEERLLSVGFSNSGRSLDNIYEKQLSAFRNHSSTASNHVFLISDFQKSSIGNLSELNLDSSNRFYLMPLEANTDANLYIDSVWLSTPFIREKENHLLNVTIANDGQDGVDNKLVKLFLGNRQVSSATVSIPGNSSETVEMTFAVNEAGDQSCRLSLEDYPVSFDNDYHFVVRVAPKIRIINISDQSEDYLESVFGSEDFFDIQTFSTKAIDYSKLAKADMVVLNQLPNINDALGNALSVASQRGANIIVFPAANADYKNYSSTLGISIRGVKQATTESKQQDIQAPSTKNPFFEGVFEKISANMSMPKAVASMSWTAFANNLLFFKTGELFLSEIDKKGHKVYLFATPLKAEFTNFHKHALFVPVMYKLAINSKMRTERLSYAFNEPAVSVKLEGISRGEVYKLVKGEFELIPPQKVINNTLLLEVPKTGLEAGTYEVRKAKDGILYGKIAFNYAKEESSLAHYKTDELKSIFQKHKNIQVYEEISEDKFVREFREKNVAKPLWRYFLVLAILALATEVALVRFWKTSKSKEKVMD